MCWTKAVQKCHNRVALVSNTVQGAADGTNFDVRAAAAPAYSSGIGAITAYSPVAQQVATQKPKTDTAIKAEALGPLP